MSKYDLCKRAKLGLQMFYTSIGREHFIAASEVEAMLKNAKVVYGQTEEVPGQVQWSETKIATDTHQARIVMIEEIKREPLRVEFEATPYHALNELSAKLTHPEFNRFVGKKLKVTIEEVE